MCFPRCYCKASTLSQSSGETRPVDGTVHIPCRLLPQTPRTPQEYFPDSLSHSPWCSRADLRYPLMEQFRSKQTFQSPAEMAGPVSPAHCQMCGTRAINGMWFRDYALPHGLFRSGCSCSNTLIAGVIADTLAEPSQGSLIQVWP